MSPPNFICEALIPNVSVFRDWTFKGVIKGLNEVLGYGLIQQDRCPCNKGKRLERDIEEKPYEDTVRKQPSMSQRERLQEKPNPMTP